MSLVIVAAACCLAALPGVSPAAPKRILAAGVIQGRQVHSGQGSRPRGRMVVPLHVAYPGIYARQKRSAAARAQAGARRHGRATLLAFGSLAGIFGGLNAPGIGAASSGGFTPPDTTGAIGPNDYVETLNSVVGAYDRTNLTPRTGSPVDLSTFVGGVTVCDPQIKYDTHTSRWFYVGIRCDSAGTTTAGTLYMGFSKTTNPANLSTAGGGGWCGYSYAFGPSLEDYPKLGLDGTHIIIGVNEFAPRLTTARIFSLPEPAAGTITSCPAAPVLTAFGSAALPLTTSVSSHKAFTPEPAMVGDSSTAGYVVSADTGGSNLMVWQVTGSGSVPTLTPLGAPSVPAFSLPANVPQPAPAPSSDVIDSSDARLTLANAASDPTLPGSPETIWTAHAVDSGTGGSVERWYEIVPGSPPTVNQVGSVSDPAGWAFNGAVTPTASGGAVINYNTGGPSQLVQLKAQSRIGSAPSGTMNTPITLASSSDFDKDFSCPSVSGGSRPCRWGDYAGGTVDPNNANVVWGTNEINGTSDGSHDAQWATQNFALTPTDVAPTASFTSSPGVVPAGSPVAFDGSASRDLDGTISSYSWSFGDGSALGSGATPSHTYATPGSYTVTLTVTDNGGQTGSISQSLVVDELPTPAFSVATVTPTPGNPVSFNGISSSDPDGSITSYSWNFGDGSPAGTGATPGHVYATPGTYTVTLTVTDSSGLTGSISQSLVVDELPTPAFSVATVTPATGLPTFFNGSSSGDPDGSIASYSWNFGDESPAGTGATPGHVYKTAGTYTVTLTVTDSSGLTASSLRSVKVARAEKIAKITLGKGNVLAVRLDGPGVLYVGSHKYAVKHAKTVKLKFPLSASQRKKLKQHHTLKVKITIKFVPKAGTTIKKTVTFVLHS